MAEHDDLVRQAAEAAAKACLRNPGAVYVSDVAELLSPFFAAARKEAREGALEEELARNEKMLRALQNLAALGRRGIVYKKYLDKEAWRHVERIAVEGGASPSSPLRSKPEEPA